MLTPDQVAAKWAQNTGAATQAYTDGVNAVTVAPGQQAARSADLWATNVAAAKSKFAANSAKVTLADWQAAAAGKGAARLASGVQAAQPKMQQALTKLLPYIAQQVNSLPARGNLDQNINRMTAFVRGMAKYNQS
jgi:hypothetical protein